MKHLFKLWDNIYNTAPTLAWTGFFCLMLVPIFIFTSQEDYRLLLGENVWIKPAKFAGSMAIYCWTFAAFIAQLNYSKAIIRKLEGWVALIISVELFIISLQAFRGVPSHHNFSTLWDGTLYTVMGIGILLNFLILVKLLRDAYQIKVPQNDPLLLGIRWGLISIILGSLIGGVMSARLQHAVGVPDGGAGLPILGWSTEGGDLRIPHFFGLHGFQIIPLFAYFSGIFKWPNAKKCINLFGGVYLLAVGGLFLLAGLGKPIL